VVVKRVAVPEVSSDAVMRGSIIISYCEACHRTEETSTGSSMGIVSWLLLPKALKSTYGKSKALSGWLLSMYRF